MNTKILCTLATLTTLLPAQTAPCLAQNDATNSVVAAITAFAFAGPTSRAYQITPGSSVVAQAIRIFTGNTIATPGFMSLEIWSHDTTTNLPLARLAGGTSRQWPLLGNSWQGCDLDSPTPLLASTSYWIVWIEGGSWQLPHDPAGVTLPTMTTNSTTWAAATPAALKYRIFCSRLDDVGVTVNGAPCATSKAKLCGLFSNQAPTVGNANFAFEASGFPAGASAAILLGVIANWPSLPLSVLPAGCLIHTDVVLSFPGTTGTGNVRANATTVGAAGHVGFVLGIPANPALVGGYVGAQVAVLDSGLTAPLPFALTNGLRVKIY